MTASRKTFTRAMFIASWPEQIPILRLQSVQQPRLSIIIFRECLLLEEIVMLKNGGSKKHSKQKTIMLAFRPQPSRRGSVQTLSRTNANLLHTNAVLSQEMRHIIFLGPQKWGLGGGQKIYVEKKVCFSVP